MSFTMGPGAVCFCETLEQEEPLVLLFDLDGTLYQNEDYLNHCRQQVFRFMSTELGVPSEEAPILWRELFKKYNQSLRALRTRWEFDTDHYWRFVREGTSRYIKQDPQLRRTLLGMPAAKYVFTNCREVEAQEALECLGVADLFDGIFGADFLGEVCKPEPAAFVKVLTRLGIDGSRAVFFEDSFKNLATAVRFDMGTVLVRGFTAREEGVTRDQMRRIDAHVRTLADGGAELKEYMHHLFEPTDGICRTDPQGGILFMLGELWNLWTGAEAARDVRPFPSVADLTAVGGQSE